MEPVAVPHAELVEDLFRKEYAHLVSALTRALGPSNLPLVEDVVHDALASAMRAWRFELPRDPKAWLVRAAHNRAIDIIRREQRHRSFLPELATMTELTGTIEAALAPAAESDGQLAMMFAVCDPGLNRETHVTMILRWLCGLSPKEIGQAFLVDTGTVDRRLHRGRGRLRRLGRLPDVDDLPDIDTRRDSVLRSLYLLFNEGYHGSDPHDPVRPFLCEDALRLTEMLLDAEATARPEVHALAALFCFDAARLPTRLDEHGVFVPLEDQDRSRWDRARIERGLVHLARSAAGDHMSRWHLEAGIACEHALAPSVRETDWDRIVGFYQVLAQRSRSPVVALNRGLAVAERDGVDAGRRELIALAEEPRLSRYPFYWAARADLERRARRHTAAREHYSRAIALSRSPAERVSFERRMASLEISWRACPVPGPAVRRPGEDQQPGGAMNDLLDAAVAAHGGLDRWNQVTSITADASITGALWSLKNQDDALKDIRFEVDTTRERVTVDFAGQDKRSVFEPHRVVLQRRDGALIDARDDPRTSFDGHQLQTPWDDLHLAYFIGEALWTYLNTPFLYTLPGFVTEEIAPVETDGETWRRLQVTFPDHVESHTRRQISCFGPDGLLRRHDFTIDVLGGATGMLHAAGYRDVDGIVIPTTRRGYAWEGDYRPVPEPLLVAIDMGEITIR